MEINRIWQMVCTIYVTEMVAVFPVGHLKQFACMQFYVFAIYFCMYLLGVCACKYLKCIYQSLLGAEIAF